jgi:hypothetical protein
MIGVHKTPDHFAGSTFPRDAWRLMVVGERGISAHCLESAPSADEAELAHSSWIHVAGVILPNRNPRSHSRSTMTDHVSVHLNNLQQRVEAQLGRIRELQGMWERRNGDASIMAMRAAVIDVIAANATVEETCVHVLRELIPHAITPELI